MYDTPRTIEQNLTMLAAAPTRLANLTASLSPAHLLNSPEPGAWFARDVLAHLPEAWSRTATVTGAGKPRERTVHMYAQWLANHEQSHIKQIERIIITLRMKATAAA